jgi:dynein heavy chain
LYKGLYKFNADTELKEYLSQLEDDKPKKKKLTKFDILMMNPKYLPKRKRAKQRFVPRNRLPSMEEDDFKNEDNEDELIKEPVDYSGIVEDLFKAKNRLKMEQIQNAVFEDNDVKEHLYNLTTGEHAIRFFAKYGNTTPIKFINCMRKSSNEFKPYDLVIIHDYQEVIKMDEYFTVSPSGIVHVITQSNRNRRIMDSSNRALGGMGDQYGGVKKKKPEESTEYISLSDWMKESTQFNIVSNIHFFKNYVSTKIFKIWRNNVKYRKYCKTRQELVKNLFYCKPAFASSVMNMNQQFQEIHSEKLGNLSIYGQNPVLFEKFKSEQRTILTQVEKTYVQIFDDIITDAQSGQREQIRKNLQ